MAAERPTPPRRRLHGTISVQADTRDELAVHLLHLATELMVEDYAPESVDRYCVTDHATSHTVVHVDEAQSAERYLDELRAWALETLRTHPRADHRAAADAGEPF